MIQKRKLIVLDLDNTLWKGIVGDVGWANILPVQDFQTALKDLKDRGIILAIASKNDEKIALEAIDCNTSMVLKRSDFVTHRINWDDKAQNIVDITNELNIGLDAVVFIDDNPVERGRVHEALAEVLVPDWPENTKDYVSALNVLDCFDTSVVTEEDRLRTEMYARERERAKSRSCSSSLEDWLKTLGTKVVIEQWNANELPRIIQLFNKTNQMNMSTRRLSNDEFIEWVNQQGNHAFTVKVSDRFGDAGLTGIICFSCNEQTVHIVDFILSCRVMGRLVEEAMVDHIINWARQNNQKLVTAQPIATAKNVPCLEFWVQRSGFEQKDQCFYFNC